MHSQLCYLLQICVQWTKLAIYSRVTAGFNIVHIITKKDITKEKPQLTSELLKTEQSHF